MSTRTKRRRRRGIAPTADAPAPLAASAPESALVHVSQELPALPGQVAQENRQHVQLTIQNVWQMPDETSGLLASSLLVQVQDCDGAGIVGAPVRLHFGCSEGLPVAAEPTDARGQAQFSRLPPGYYTVQAGLPGDAQVVTLAPVPLLPGEKAVRTLIALARPGRAG